MLGVERIDGRLFLDGDIDGLSLQFSQATGVAIGKIDSDRDPLPAFGGDRLGLGRQLLGGQAIEQRDVLQPAATVVLEQVAQDRTTGCLIGLEPDEPRPAVGRRGRRSR